MSRVLAAVARYAAEKPQSPAIEGSEFSLSYAELECHVTEVAAFLRKHDVNAVALLADNGPLWAVADLACVQAELPLIPVPFFFSPTQISHLITTAGTDAVLTDQPEQVLALIEQLKLGCNEPLEIGVAGHTFSLIQLTVTHVELPDDCAKVTFTSGSTGEPKGVCLQQQAMEMVALSLADATSAHAEDRHISLLPYATLLENIGGLYAPLISGATVIAPTLEEVGMSGASGLDVQRFVSTLVRSGATTCIMIPQMLHALLAAIASGAPGPNTLRFIAVGGAPVSEYLLQQAEQLGLPVYEGYGLSEAASVVAVNRPGEHKLGSVGKVLPHAEVKFAPDGEILVKGGLFSSYLGEKPFTAEFWPSGDIGHLDEGGFLYLSGRKKHIFITAFGRNVSPEWVERELSIEPAIAQCCLFGEVKPFNVALIVARNNAPAEAIQAAVDAANARLPDYAQVSRWLMADAPFSVGNGLWTGTGRPRRKQIFQVYEDKINRLYEES